MDVQKIYRNMLLVSALGILYALYFVWQKLTALSCSFPCVELFGIPSCYLGLAGFTALFALAWAAKAGRISVRVAKYSSLLFTAFALYVSFLELPLGFPICSVGAALAFLYFCMAYRAETGDCPLCRVKEGLKATFKL